MVLPEPSDPDPDHVRASDDIPFDANDLPEALSADDLDADALPPALQAAEPATPQRGALTAHRPEDHAAEQALVLRVMRQDEAALAALYGLMAARVMRQVMRLVRDTPTAEEVVEDVFWQVWRQAPRFDAARGTVAAWIMQMARSRALDALRARGRHPLVCALNLEDDAHMPVAEGADPVALIDREQTARRVQHAMALLDPLRRQLLALAFEQGYSQSEIAQHTGLPLGTVKSHIRRALAAMKTVLEPTLAAAAGDRA